MMPGYPARWWKHDEQGCPSCDLCPQACIIPDGNSGRCGSRYADSGKLWTRAWEIGTSPFADPVEKKPLNHFLPGSKVLSFGLPGCNLRCSFCQNWSLSVSSDYDSMQRLTSEQCVQMALAHACSAIAFTYNEPTISSEFCIEMSRAAHLAGIKTVTVSNGCIQSGARHDLYDAIDAANIDLKSINPEFYTKYCDGRLEPVLETLVWLANSRRTWLELTNLLIPSLNDSDADINSLVDWISTHLGSDVPLHFSAFHPAYRMQNLPNTPYTTLSRARNIALSRGLRYVYLGNTNQPQCTLCPNCQREVIRRVNHTVVKNGLLSGKCSDCKTSIAGVFEVY